MGEVHGRIRPPQNKYIPHLLKDHFSWRENMRQKVYFWGEERKTETSLAIYVCDLWVAGGKKQYFLRKDIWCDNFMIKNEVKRNRTNNTSWFFSKTFISGSVSVSSANKFGGPCWTKVIVVVSLTEQKISLLSKPKENKDRKKRDRARPYHSVCSAHLHTGKCVKLRYGEEAQYFLTSGHERFSGLPATSLKTGSQRRIISGLSQLKIWLAALLFSKFGEQFKDVYCCLTALHPNGWHQLEKGYWCAEAAIAHKTACCFQWNIFCQWELHIPPNREYNVMSSN